MTLRAIVTEIPRHVVRVCRLLELLLMALVAIRVMQLVVPIHVARLACCCNVGTCQREERCAVVECCRVPVRCRVTLRAIVTEVARHVVRVCRLLELLLMALEAIIVHQLIVPVRMARLALCAHVRACQRKTCRRVGER